MAKDITQQIANDLSAGKFAAAQKRARILAKREPKNAAVQNFTGAVFGQCGMHRPSISYFQAAVRAAPNNQEFRSNLILSLIMSDEFAKADAMIKGQLKTSPNSAKLQYLRAFGYHRAQNHNAAIIAANLALNIDPHFIDALNIRGVSYSELHQTEQALADFQSILKLKPNDLNALQNCAERLNELGQKNEALAKYEAMLKLAPQHGYALSKVASLCQIDAVPKVIKTAEQVLAHPKLPPNEKAVFSLAVAVGQDRLGDTKAAMKMYDQVHAIDAKDRPYNSGAAWAEFKKVKALFPEPLANRPQDATAPTPIFVVGLPRSGTTLVEMMLTTSPQVLACGERVTAERLYQDMFSSAPHVAPQHLTDFAQRYLGEIQDMPLDTLAFVDKMPANFRYIGLLLSAFPNAKIVNVQRDPRDVALSMWKQRFTAAGMAYASKLSSIADQANIYRSYMAHWHAVYPEQILSVDYEGLVQDADAVSRQLAAHCAIDWSEAMLRPDVNRNKVRTASINQVRERIHTRSVGQWRHFGDNLKHLTSNLDPELWPEII